MSRIPNPYQADLIAIRNKEKQEKYEARSKAKHMEELSAAIVKKINKYYVGKTLYLFTDINYGFSDYENLIENFKNHGWEIGIANPNKVVISPLYGAQKLYNNTLYNQIVSWFNNLIHGQSLAIID